MANVSVESALLPPKRSEVGETVVLAKISLSASWSSGDVHRIGKIPHGAIITDALFSPGAASPVGFVAKFGTSLTQDLLLFSATYSVMTRMTRNIGYRIQPLSSISDDVGIRYDYLTMVATVGCSIGHVGDLVVRYLSNPNA